MAQPTDSLSRPPAPGKVARNPELAGTLSWILPGLGQIYNGNVGKGLLQMELYLGGIGMIASSQIGFSHNSITPAAWTSVAIVAATFLWSVIDAVTTAREMNSAGEGSSAILQVPTGPCALTFDMAPSTRAPRATIVIWF